MLEESNVVVMRLPIINIQNTNNDTFLLIVLFSWIWQKRKGQPMFTDM